MGYIKKLEIVIPTTNPDDAFEECLKKFAIRLAATPTIREEITFAKIEQIPSRSPTVNTAWYYGTAMVVCVAAMAYAVSNDNQKQWVKEIVYAAGVRFFEVTTNFVSMLQNQVANVFSGREV